MLVGLIVVCEVLFWVVLLSGLVARYLLRRPGLGAVMLVAAPFVDLILLTASALDLRGGGTATLAHGLAAVYIGVSVGFGHSMVRWADARFAHRYAGGPAPEPKPRHGRAHAAYERRAWLRHVAAWATGCALIEAAVVLVGDPDRTEALAGIAGVWTIVLVVDGIISLSYTLSPRKPRRPGQCSEPASSNAPSWRTLSLIPRDFRSRRISLGRAKSRLSSAATTGCTSSKPRSAR